MLVTEPSTVAGSHADRVLAFARADADGDRVVAIVAMRSVEEWSDTTVVLPEGSWRNVLEDDGRVVVGGGPVSIVGWLDRFPVALLDRVSSRLG